MAARRSILAGVDGSPGALHAVRWAAGEAARRHVSLRLCHVRGEGGERGGEWLRAAEWAARDLAPGIEVRRLSPSGEVCPTLVRESADAALTVLGPGPVAVAVAAACSPVVVVRGRTPGEPPPDGGPVVAGGSGAAVEFAAGEAVLRGAGLISAPGSLLVRSAGARLVVVGAGAAAGLGETALALLRHGGCPVAVVR
ncbi:universal stress protein [Amycolatopsis acidicola]|uniref:Universal stress protein n=1 Tax=Amycolatopsis acidicola TaxID=2596893 RepID=A0A5N0UL81_9PSEU|nr:universal stress protein [Amycolatopsis acidicola]KAA9149822.1 universal stress protein [Amycolatopsis acidicola]